MPKSNTKKPSVTNTRDESLPTEIRSRIKDFKEMFPQYRHSSDLDILAVFDEFNNDYNAAVYGVANGLVKSKPSETWQTAGQKKKTKRNVRGKSVTPKNPRNDYTDSKRAANSNRGQSASRGRSRGGKGAQGSTRPAPGTAPKDNKSTPSQRPSESTTRPSSATGSKKQSTPAQKTPVEPVRVAVPKPSSTPVTEHLSYANAAKSRKPWSPISAAKPEPSKPTKESSTATAAAPSAKKTKAAAAPKSSISSTVQSNSSLPSTSANAPMNNHPGSNVNPFGVPSGERTGVLMPGNFRNDETMSFQFGNLGLVDEDQTTKTSSEPEKQKSKKSSKKATPATTAPKDETPEAEAHGMVSGMPMGQYSPYPPMYQMDPSAMDPSAPRGPMTYYPDAQYQQHYQRDSTGKYSRPASNPSQNYPTGRGEPVAAAPPSKFNSESSAKGSTAAQGQTSAQQTTPYPYAPGPYPMYGHPFVNSFPGGSYGNQPFYGFYKQPGYPGYQNFGNNQMGYAQGEGDQRGAYYPNQDGTAPAAPTGAPSKAPNGSSPPKQGSAPPGLEGSASQYNPDAFKNQAGMDYYAQDPYMNASSFMTPQPFGYPPMGQQNYPVPAHPQQGSGAPSSQQSSQNPTNTY